MHDLVKNLMTEEEFNTLSEDTRNTIEDEARKANGYLDWHHLTRYVNFTEDEIRKFVIKHYDKINPMWCKKYQKNWNESIEQEYNFIKTMNDPNILTEMKAVFTKYGYDYNIFIAMKNALK